MCLPTLLSLGIQQEYSGRLPKNNTLQRLLSGDHKRSFMKQVDPLIYRDWNEHVLATPHASIFHSTHWLRVLQASYGYQPYYFACFKGQQLTALLPLMEVKSWITGVRGVSLPFAD